MSYSTLILGESGTGKTASLRNLDPAKTLLIQPIRKPIPFRSAGWKEITAKGDGHNIFVCNDPRKIVQAMAASPFDIIVVDDFQYIMSMMFMDRRAEKGFDKFTDIGGAGYDIAKAAAALGPEKRVYILSHTQSDELGNTRIKTIGKLLDEKIVLEGMFTTVLRTYVENGRYYFTTQNNGHDTVKSPMGLFNETLIENDLAAVDAAICDYYGIEQPAEPAPATNEPKAA